MACTARESPAPQRVLEEEEEEVKGTIATPMDHTTPTFNESAAVRWSKVSDEDLTVEQS